MRQDSKWNTKEHDNIVDFITDYDVTRNEIEDLQELVQRVNSIPDEDYLGFSLYYQIHLKEGDVSYQDIDIRTMNGAMKEIAMDMRKIFLKKLQDKIRAREAKLEYYTPIINILSKTIDSNKINKTMYPIGEEG